MPKKQEKPKMQEKKGPAARFRLKEETLVKTRKVAGCILVTFAVFTLVSVISYLFTWKSDYSLLSDASMMDASVHVDNLGGKLGYRWGHFLVGRCFGLGSFALILLLFSASYKVFFNKGRILRMLVLTVAGAVLFSVILSYVSGLAGADTAFGGGLGGDCGAVTAAWFGNLVGPVVTGILLAVFTVVWLLYASGRFSAWFVTAGDSFAARRQAGSGDGPLTAEEGQTGDGTADGHDADIAGNDFSGPEIEPEPVPVPVRPVRTAPVPVTGKDEGFPDGREPRETDSGSGDAETDGLTVEAGEGLPENIKELPRIDTWEELSKYKFPSLDLLKDYSEARHEVSREELERNNSKIRATLRNYKIEVLSVTACPGPTVTLYKVTPAPGVKIAAIRSREEDIAMALGAKGVRVVNLPDSVGIEVANDNPSIVPLKSMFSDPAFSESKYELPIAIGYTITQKVKTFDLADAPHLLVAGATKQGKSVGLNVIISSLLYKKHPSELKFVFVDPKMVEFNAYAGLLKHSLAVLPTASNEQDERANAIIKKQESAEQVLRSLVLEMDERYELMSRTSANNIKLYNDKYKDRHLLPTDGHRFMPYIVVVIDEYADLIMSGGTGAESKNMARSITTSIIRLAQKGRAAGIHVILATQRPSVDVITGIIKANFPMRIAFRTLSRVDSNTILDSSGAEKLIGKGDMLYYSGVEMERVQCAFVSMDEIVKITDSISSQTGYRQCYTTPYYLPMPPDKDSGDGGSGGMTDMTNLDSQFREAAEIVVLSGQGSTSSLQRKLGMGYARAGKVMDQLEAAGIVGPQEGSKPREVLVHSLDELNEILEKYS